MLGQSSRLPLHGSVLAPTLVSTWRLRALLLAHILVLMNISTTYGTFMPDENGDEQRVQFDPNYQILDSFRKEECALWREYREQQ